MNRIDKKFEELKSKDKKAFIAYITAGDPTLGFTEELVPLLEGAGVSIVELGVPFSDPMADGVTIQKSSERALKSDTTLRKIIKSVDKIRRKTDIPIMLFTYLNPVFQYGWKEFAKDANNAGVDGALILDLPIEESYEERAILRAKDMKMIYLLAPTSTDERIKMTCSAASGFIYYVSRTGVTGVRQSVESTVNPMIKKIKQYTDLPVAVGFGVSSRKQVLEIGKCADAVVVGSAIVSEIEKKIGEKDSLKNAINFVKSLTGI